MKLLSFSFVAGVTVWSELGRAEADNSIRSMKKTGVENPGFHCFKEARYYFALTGKSLLSG